MADSNVNKPELNENDLEKTLKDEHEDTDYQDEEPSEKDHDGDDHQLSEGEIRDPDPNKTRGEQEQGTDPHAEHLGNRSPPPDTDSDVIPILDEPDTNPNQRNLRNRGRDLDYKALATGRIDPKEKKKRTTTRTEKGRGLQDQGLGERAPTLVNEEIKDNVGQGERAPTNIGLGERAPTGKNKRTGKGKSTGATRKRTNQGQNKEESASTSTAIEDERGATQAGEPQDGSTQGDTETELELHPVERPTKPEKKKKRHETPSESSSDTDTTSSSSSSSSESSSDTDTTPKRRTRRKDSKKTKKMLKKYKTVTKELEKENRRLEGKMEEKRKSIRRKEDEIARYKRKYEETIKKCQKMQHRIDELENEKERSHQENAKLKEKMKRSEYVKEELKQQRVEVAKRCENAERELAESKKKIDECEALNNELLNKLTSARASTVQRRPSSQNKLKLIFIGDSNSRRITPHLDRRNKWDCSENTYVIRDLERVKCDTTYDGAVFLLGTNDIKKGNDGKREAENLIQHVKEFQHAKHLFILELPPINRRGTEVERRIFNNTLHNQNSDNRFQIIRMTREIEHAPVETALEDDLHLTRENAKQMATHIENIMERHIANNKTQEPERPRRERMEQKFEEARQRNERSREEKRNIPCHFYLQGRCHKGNRCFFGHDKPSAAENKERSRSTERRHSDLNRSRSQSGDRRRVVLSDRGRIRPVDHE